MSNLKRKEVDEVTGNTRDEAKKMAVDADGNIYVTGTSGGSTPNWSDIGNDIVTIKYNAAGEKLWEARYNSPYNLADVAIAITVDQNGNAYVAGHSLIHPWSTIAHYTEYVTIKYDPNGNEIWTRQYAPSWIWNFPTGMGMDSNGNVYVTGNSHSLLSGYTIYGSPWESNFDIATFKYDSDGVMEWMNVYNSAVYVSWMTPEWQEDGDDWPSAITVDADGNVYIAGTFASRYPYSWSFLNYRILKYDANGSLQWTATYAAPSGMNSTSAIAVDTNRNVYVTGYSRVGTDYDYVTVKYDSSGIQQWVATYTTPGGGTDIPTAMAIDGAGNVYVTGYGGLEPTHYTTIKYDTNGNQLWIKEYKGSGNLGDITTSIVLDNNGNAYVTGNSQGEGTGYDFTTIKYSPDGTEEWIQRYNGSGNGDDYANTLTIDKEGNVYVAGGGFGSGTKLDYTVVKYSPATVVTVDVKPGSFPNSINRDSNGIIPVAILSTSDFDATNINPLTVKFGPAGATEAHGMGHIEDVNADGLLDIVLHFNTAETGIQEGETSASLVGKTLDGKKAIMGSDSIVTLGKRDKSR